MFAPGASRYLGAVVALVLLVVVLVALHVFAFGWFPIAVLVVLLGLGGFFGWFFRDPERAPGTGIVSAADGRVRAVSLEGERWRISVFMNVTDVHVNRFPWAGRVRSVSDAGQGFRPAYVPEAEHNVQRHYVVDTSLGEVEIVQMTGIVARRLVSLVHAGDERAKADRLGLIVLGSRVDVLLPRARARPTVNVGDRVRAGASTIADEVVA
ncbi:MAG: phosphatidylserine decarboxylase [Thermoplasmata archaeon]